MVYIMKQRRTLHTWSRSTHFMFILFFIKHCLHFMHTLNMYIYIYAIVCIFYAHLFYCIYISKKCITVIIYMYIHNVYKHACTIFERCVYYLCWFIFINVEQAHLQSVSPLARNRIDVFKSVFYARRIIRIVRNKDNDRKKRIYF